ncbi:hypothetical protein BDV38DRAFT_240368 [Aspergillus pseudotamarii]|uniref:Uncharacterized protein n=1 Tax=Aspergillus pseudotamarii TaxID=132259 RepID=A0A5N6T209_ASPPS|nr:uncharacterized protein BDV38DRAFT_240368 [Aspergillus pseudotamarii]KAE8140323.1 hypothetical protein BDV38DRAFT_240368 [Aspergillus pseudotamarii]
MYPRNNAPFSLPIGRGKLLNPTDKLPNIRIALRFRFVAFSQVSRSEFCERFSFLRLLCRGLSESSRPVLIGLLTLRSFTRMDPRPPWAKVRTFVLPLIEGHPGIGQRSIVGLVHDNMFVIFLVTMNKVFLSEMGGAGNIKSQVRSEIFLAGPRSCQKKKQLLLS